MKIEDMGVKITAGSGSVYHEIVITPEDGIYVNGASWSRAEAVDVAHALSTAVEKHDAMTRTQEQPVPAFAVGQVLTGDEDLPIGTEVSDCEGDLWVMRSNGSLSLHQPEGSTPLRAIVRELSPVKIMSLP